MFFKVTKTLSKKNKLKQRIPELCWFDYGIHFRILLKEFVYTKVKPKKNILFFSWSNQARRLLDFSKGRKFESFKDEKLSKLMF
jgi:hypothetical protein